MKMVERELSAAGFEDSQISGGGLKITTTSTKMRSKLPSRQRRSSPSSRRGLRAGRHRSCMPR